MTTLSKAPVVVVAADNLAPALASTLRVIEPSETPPSNNSAVKDVAALFCSSSKANVSASRNVKVAVVCPMDQSTRGVLLSVSGGDPHADHVPGTVSNANGISKFTVCAPSVIDVGMSKSPP